MNVRGRDALTDAVAVSRMHKRQRVARCSRGSSTTTASVAPHFAALSAFQPDFTALGFGCGTPVQRFRFAPQPLRARQRPNACRRS
jgi:hypothetical protein